MNLKVMLVGCGNMGFAMLKGWINQDALKADDIYVIEPAEILRQKAQSLGVHVMADANGLSADFDPAFIILAVKPQVMPNVLPAYQRFAQKSAFLSVAAGIPVAQFEKILGDGTAIIRCMPNTPAAIGQGMMVTFANKNVNAAQAEFVKALLGTSGAVANIDDETQMDAVTAVSGSGPAYVFYFIEALTEAGVKAGLPRETASLLAMQTIAGAGALAAASNEDPAELRRQVTSPNGTTAAALDVLMAGDMQDIINKAVDAARLRSEELGRG
ncbi:pyrroline-5-carboxylate reductase [Paenochrobactrum pullorum]|uniref:pyrroline-5-carboxylate reductase n=1 Tax=Paenochrobactrum pullorum TaxID=1324351 RepID=UPI0035BC67A5